MKIRFARPLNGRVFLSLLVLAVITAVFTVPFSMRSEAAHNAQDATTSHDPALPNYDIRTDKSAYQIITDYRSSAGRSSSSIADLRDGMVRGEASLKQRVPTLKLVYNDDIRIPEVIGPDVKQGRAFLTRPSNVRRSDILKNFLTENAELVGARDSQINELKVAADYTNPAGNLSFVELNQEINGIPVFRGEIKAGFAPSGAMARVINNFAPGLDYASLPTDFGDPLAAVTKAAQYINNDGSRLDLRANRSASTELKAVFGVGDWATTAEKMYFPTEPGVAVPAWRVLIWQPVNAFYVIVDANTGVMLWRKNISEDQTQAATYNVYGNSNSMINVSDNPFPMTPGSTSPNGAQGTAIPRTMMTLVGNEAPYEFNNNGWITDGNNTTDGNALAAGLDRDSANGIDANGVPTGASRVFNYPFAPGIPTNPALNEGESPLPPGAVPGQCVATAPEMIDFQRAAVTQLFYITNRIHDEAYRLGFTEQARNFQHENFGRGGLGNDRVSGEAQDCSGTGNANFNTPADGGRGRMQMYLWVAPTPDFDGDLDADVIIHEYTHGISNRLHGNASGLASNMSRGMGEGWGDFFGHAMLSEPSDPINGIYTTGSYDTYRGGPGFNNYYYGIRRFPKAVMAFTGGPNNRPHNPLTFADIDGLEQNLNDGAYPPRFSGNADQVHNAGEVWSTTLWEVRARYIQRLGWEVGNRRILQHVMDGMKLAPFAPTFLTERDAIIAGALAGGTDQDVDDLWRGFAIRGMGFSATIETVGTGNGSTRVTEAFDPPNLRQDPQLIVSDSTGDNDGAFEPGETLSVTVPISNSTGNLATGVTVQIVGGGSADYGTIPSGQTVTRTISYTVPAVTPCGNSLDLTLNANSSLGPVSFQRRIFIGTAITTESESFDLVPAPAFPDGWTVATLAGGTAFVSTTTGSDTAPNSAFAVDPTTVGGGTDLTSPVFSIPSGTVPALVSFRNKYDTEGGWDGGVLEISVAGGAYQDIITAGGVFIQNGYNGSLGGGANNPIANRPAWTGQSDGYITSIIRLPAAAMGQDIRLKFRFGADDNTAAVGWNIDTIKIQAAFSCSLTGVRSRGDFDGDGKSDISVYRPSEGNWYLDRSTAGFTGVNFGLASDILTPGDFDGDGKADVAVFRPSTGTWYRVNSGSGDFSAVPFGTAGDIPQSGDFDGDGKDDLAVFRPSNGTWYWQNSSNGQFGAVQFGQNGDKSVAGDYDGDGKDDVSVYRPSNQFTYRINSGNGQIVTINFSPGSGLPLHADFDGDNREDIGLFRLVDGTWWWLRSSDGQTAAIQFGQDGDIPVPGDFDGDGKDDQAVYRNGAWYINRSTAGFTAVSFGLANDTPVLNKYIP